MASAIHYTTTAYYFHFDVAICFGSAYVVSQLLTV